MVKIKLEVADPLSTSGFEMGNLEIIGEEGSGRFYCMIVLSATLLMDQMSHWLRAAKKGDLEFNPVDCSGSILLKEEKGGLGVWVDKKRIARIDIGELLQEIARACRELANFVNTLPEDDAGRYDFESSLSEFIALAAAFERPSRA